MGRDAQKAVGNIWFEARMKASKWNERLSSREGVESELGISVDALRRIENGVNKIIPVDSAVLLADLYNAPELLNHYCLNECPIGCRRSLSAESHDIDRVTVKLLRGLRISDLQKVKDKLLDIAEDGHVDEDEIEDLKEVVEFFKSLQRTSSELEIICEKVTNKREKSEAPEL